MSFMCLLDLMKLKFCSLNFELGVLIEVQLFVRFDEDKIVLFFCSLNFELGVFRICLVLGINHIKWLGKKESTTLFNFFIGSNGVQ